MRYSKLLCTAALALAPQFCLAQPLAFKDAASAADSATAAPSSAGVVAATTATKAPAEQPLTHRWLDLETLSNSERYRDTFVKGGAVLWQNAQQRTLIAGKLKFDEDGRYAIGFRVSSGHYFNWAFSSYTGESVLSRSTSAAYHASTFTAAQYLEIEKCTFVDKPGYATLLALKSNGAQLYFRELYLSASPVKPITVEFGSLGIERGYGSEITTFDEDGYISGERIAFHSPKHLFFDEAKFTNAFFGDFATANFFQRGGSLTRFNYRQASAKKQLTDRIGFSADYTWLSGTDTLREALVVKTKELKAIDSVRFEAYERLNAITLAGGKWPYGVVAPLPVGGGSGFSVAVDEKIGKLRGDLGYADIDQNYSVYANSRFFHAEGFSLNGDTIAEGEHPFVHAAYQLAPGVSAVGFYTHGLTSQGFDPNRQGWAGGMSFDLKAMINREKRVF